MYYINEHRRTWFMYAELEQIVTKIPFVNRELADATTYSLTFKDADIEKQYIRRPNPCPMMIALIPSVVVPSYAIIALFATPSSWPLHAIYIALVLEIGCFNITYLACIRRAAKDVRRI